MALKFMDGVGHYATADILKKWNASTTGNTVNTGGNGPQGGNVIRGTSSGSLWMSKNFGGTESTIIAGYWVKKLTIIGATTRLVRFKEGATIHATIGIDASGFITAYRGDGATLLGTAATGALAADIGYYIQAKVKVHDSTGTVEVKVCQAGGTPTTVLSLTGQDTRNGGTGFCDTVDWFPGLFIGASAGDGYIAEFFVFDTTGSANNDFLTETWQVTHLLPTADGTYSQLTPSTGTDHYVLVDETTPNTTDYNSSATAPNKDTYVMGNLASSSTSYYGVQTLIAALKDAAPATSACTTVRSGSTDADGTSTALATTQSYLRDVWGADPATSAAWTLDGINALEVGMKVTASGANARASQAVLEVLRSVSAASAARPGFFVIT